MLKEQKFAYFQFGGYDIDIVFQAGREINITAGCRACSRCISIPYVPVVWVLFQGAEPRRKMGSHCYLEA